MVVEATGQIDSKNVNIDIFLSFTIDYHISITFKTKTCHETYLLQTLVTTLARSSVSALINKRNMHRRMWTADYGERLRLKRGVRIFRYKTTASAYLTKQRLLLQLFRDIWDYVPRVNK